MERLLLFSKGTAGFFEKLGFVETLVTEAANALRSAPQVQRYDQIGWRPDERAFGMDLAATRRGSEIFRRMVFRAEKGRRDNCFDSCRLRLSKKSVAAMVLRL